MRKIFVFIITTALLLPLLTGCFSVSKNPADSTVDQTTESNTQTNTSTPNPESDFEYEINNEGGITITRYIGQSSTVVIPPTIDNKPVTEIGASAFFRNHIITSTTVPNTVKVINADAFGNCTSLETVILSNNLESILDEAFRNCNSLSRIVLPNSLVFLGSLSFAECKSLKHIVIPPNCFSTAPFVSACFDSSGLETITLSEGIETLPNSLLRNTNIRQVILPSTIKEIKGSVFENCKELKNIILNDGLIAIGSNVFANTGIEELIIPASVTTLTEWTFLHSSLKKVKFEGNAPKNYINPPIDPSLSPFIQNYTVFYHNGAEGFVSPTWNNHPTEIW